MRRAMVALGGAEVRAEDEGSWEGALERELARGSWASGEVLVCRRGLGGIGC